MRKFFKIINSLEARILDEIAQSKYGLSPEILMEDAGSAVYEVARRFFGLDKKYLVVAGTGNNGGDALVAGRRLYSSGSDVKVAVIGDVSKGSVLMKTNLERLIKLGVETTVIDGDDKLGEFRKLVDWADILIVGIFGTGLRGEVRDYRRNVIEAINISKKHVISVDLPSGVNPDNGRIEGVAVKSTITVTFGLPKIGNILHPGGYYSGKLYVSRLSYPPELLDSGDFNTELNYPIEIPERVKWGHKGSFGKYLAVAGSRYYYGAPYYATQSFLSSGGGYARLATVKSIVPVLASRSSEIVYHPLDETGEGSIAYSSLGVILELVNSYGIDILAVGPGLSTDQETLNLVVDLLQEVRIPVIVNGDGLTAIARQIEVLKNRKAPTILTPHPGEFSRLSNLSLKEIEENPIGVARDFAKEFNCYLVLKGSRSIISFPNGRVFINVTGNPGMAKAGMGDVLVGVIAAMYGIGLREPGSALRMAVLAHGLAGDLVAEEVGEDGVTPDLVITYLPKALNILRKDKDYVLRKYFPEEL
ncbi:NAD(P)H-hydrate dehydratase [Thermogladius sp. 4427co]|uniref:NAD(P)H-hydrate dehydratase n=1 Tax=Thermogladius sp. 4427co TaxID=3450718 RepID=UPI003F7B07C8